MSQANSSFEAGIDFESVLRIISKQIYETPLAFLRENVQNAVDAVRIQAFRGGLDPSDDGFRIDIIVEDSRIVVRDNGIGMTAHDLRAFFWTIGASGKRTEEAIQAGCVGTFGIGGFANFGVCSSLEVASQTEGDEVGTLTRLSQGDIRAAGSSIPLVSSEPSSAASPRGTVVTGALREIPNIEELRRYVRDFVRFVPTAIYFNGERLSQARFTTLDDRENLTDLSEGLEEWTEGDLLISGRLYEDRGHSLIAAIQELHVAGEHVGFTGHIRFENGTIDVFKRGFKLCATQVGTTIGVSGRLDCDRFVPTAGRDSLDSDTTSLLGRVVLALERVAIERVLRSPERIAQHTRVFRYVVQRGLIDRLDRVRVAVADGSDSVLGDIRRRAEMGVSVYFGVAQKQALNQLMQARGHIVVLLSGDRFRRQAETLYLQRYCSATPFDGLIECSERYEDLTRFEKVFLSELEMNIARSYEVAAFSLLPGRLTEDLPVFVKEDVAGRSLEIFVDVRHPEVTKLECLGFSQVLYSLIATFCREFLGPSLKKWSPRFFGDGALNLELLAKRRSELWILMKDDIGIVRQGGQRHVVTRSDVRTVNVASPASVQQAEAEIAEQGRGHSASRILHLVDDLGTTDLGGFYIRLPDSAFTAYGDLLPECDSRGVVWAGNKVLYVASDAVSAAFQYEIRLDQVITAAAGPGTRVEGALELEKPLHEMFNGLYFPIPQVLEPFLVPTGDEEIRLELHCDWIDMRTAKHWAAAER